MRGKRVSTFRVIGHPPSNMILGHARIVSRWNKYKTRLMPAPPGDGADRAQSMDSDSAEGETTERDDGLFPRLYHGGGAQSSMDGPRPAGAIELPDGEEEEPEVVSDGQLQDDY